MTSPGATPSVPVGEQFLDQRLDLGDGRDDAKLAQAVDQIGERIVLRLLGRAW